MAKRGRKGKGQRTAAPGAAPAEPASKATTAAAVEASAPTADPASVAPVRAATMSDTAPTPRDGAVSPSPVSNRESRALASALIAAFLLFQIAMPLRYYLGGRGYDERFSWRMFSSVRMQRCEVQVRETSADGSDRKLDLERELQVAWIGMLERYRAQVVEELLRKRCAQPGTREVRYTRSCRDTDGSELPKIRATLDCARDVLAVREDAP
jgi:hypothetical protein